jgi:nicotinate-nucleotide--dimethylbenzimidazole phosphoribosyltransferase
LGAGSIGVPIVLDGFITAAAALTAVSLCSQVRDYCIAGHGSVEPGHQVILSRLEMRPLLDLNMRLGEASGALLALPLIMGSLRILREMATFSAAGVTDTGA